jgi:prevent-host-death family protein
MGQVFNFSLTPIAHGVTVRHMKTITIRELHAKTGRWVREVARHGQIRVTDHGRTVAQIVPAGDESVVPYFARRKFINRTFQALVESGKLGRGGTDSAIAISEDRQERV